MFLTQLHKLGADRGIADLDHPVFVIHPVARPSLVSGDYSTKPNATKCGPQLYVTVGNRVSPVRHVPTFVAFLLSPTDMEARMSVESHLAELARRHEALKREIQEAQTHPGFDEFEVSALKRRKLHIKDEIAKLKANGETRH